MFISPLTPRFALRPLVAQLLAIAGFGLSAYLPTVAIAQSDATNDGTRHSLTQAQQRHQDSLHQDHVLGTSLDMLAISASPSQTQRAFTAALAEINRLDRILSTYRTDSEISTLNHPANDGKSVAVSTDLLTVIDACEAWRTQSGGAFSGRMGQLIQQHNNNLISVDTRAELAQQANNAQVVLDTATQSITRPQTVQFAIDALAKGYIIDRAISAARQAVPELSGFMVDIGGDVKVWGQAPRATGWNIGLRAAGQRADNALPAQTLQLKKSASVAFSGKGARDIQHSNDSHLLSPISGQALNHVEQSIVVAPHAADADALATALAAMTPAEGMALIAQLKHTEAQMTLSNGQTFSSSGWHDLVATEQNYGVIRTVATSNTSANAAWPAGYHAILDYEIPKPSSSNYHAPYVVIWVTDANRKLVRTLHVFGSHDKWIDSNYVWWKRYGRIMSNLDTVAKPSRAPGRYTVDWDGKDDAGQRVAQGKYTLHIEAAREHGGHSYQTFDIDAAPKSSTQNSAAKDEFGDLKFRFDRAI